MSDTRLPTTRLLVLRHGESEWNAQRRWQGQQDPPLTQRGRRQAAATADLLGVVDAVWCSTLQRATDSALIIAELLGVGPVVADERLQERGFGAWEGLTAAEVEQRWPGHLAAGRRPDDAETTEPMLRRVQGCLADIAERHRGGEVLVITHAGVLRGLREHLGHGIERIDNLDGASFTVHGNGEVSGGEAVLVGSLADVGHELSETM
jgi:probable phosphoglycerate mutase